MRLRSLAVIVMAGVATLATPSLTFGMAGDVDPTFGIGGKVVVSFGPSEERTNATVLQADGKIVTGGALYGGGEGHFLVSRFTSAGVLDPTFGSGGSVSTTVANPNEFITSLLLQPDGKIVAVGNTFGTAAALALVRYESDGSLDATFGSGGKTVATIGPGRGTVYAALLQPDGKIVAAGVSIDPPGLFAVARFDADGIVDATFGVAGEVLTDVGPFFDSGLCAALQPDGRILVAGPSFTAMGIVRYESDGSLDASFGTGGIIFGGEPVYPRAMALQPNGKIVVAGDGDDGSGGSSDFNFKIRRLNADGTPDMTFNGGDAVTTVLGPYEDLGLSVVLQPSGRIVMGGYKTTSGFSSAEFALVRYQADGALDASFGLGGIVTTSVVGFARDTAAALVLQPDSKIVAAGEHYFPPNGDVALVRYLGNTCGDGMVEAGEQCDDGNTADDDCCDSACQYDAAAASCNDDGNACTSEQCDGAGTCISDTVVCSLCEVCDTALGCVGRPRLDCAAPGSGGASALVLRDRGQDAGDRARWVWRSGSGVGDVGDPITSDDYAFCIFEGAGADLWLAAAAPAGDLCAGQACWTALGQPPLSLGAEYRDSQTTPDGISSLLLRARGGAAQRMRLKARGALLQLPALDSLHLPLRVQIQRADTACWEATFNAARVSTRGLFEAAVK